MKELKFNCCFCNNTIELSDIDPCNINFMANYGKEVEYQPNQDFFCHFKCLKERLHSYYQRYFLETTFSLNREED
jgi:hypothetical protein